MTSIMQFKIFTMSFTELDLQWRDDYFRVNFYHFITKQTLFFETAGAVAKIGLKLKSNHQFRLI
jgi:hypothetical protein